MSKVIQLKLHIDIINSLKSGHLDPKQNTKGLGPTLCALVSSLIAVLFNVVQVTTEARQLYREQDITEVIQRFRTGNSNAVSLSAIMLLAWVSDKENASDKDFSLLNQDLKSSLHEVPHRSQNEHSAVELLAAINKLIVNDENKERFVKCGGLLIYAAFLEPQFDA